MKSRDREKYKNIAIGAVVGLIVSVVFPWVGNMIEKLLNQLGL